MNGIEILRKADRGEGLTEDEVKRYHVLVKPKTHTYGKYGSLAKVYLEEHNVGKFWALVAAGELPTYLHNVDKQAEDLYEVLHAKLSVLPEYTRTGDYLTDVRRLNAMKKAIEDEILSEIVYVD